MLNAVREQREEWANTRPLSELIPWITMISPGVVLCKDGSLFGVLEMEGLDLEGHSDSEIDHAAASVERALRVFDERHHVMWITDRSKAHIAQNSDPRDRVDELYREWVEQEEFYSMHNLMIIGLKPPSGSSRLFAPLFQALSKEISWGSAIRAAFGGKSRFGLAMNMLESQHESLNSIIRQFASTLPEFSINRVEGDELLGWLNALAAPATPRHPVHIDQEYGYLDTALGENILQVEHDYLTFQGPVNRQYMAALTIKEWPKPKGEETATNPEMMAPLLSLPAEYTFVRIFRPLSAEKSRTHINSARRHHTMRSTPMVDQLRKSMAKNAHEVEVQKDPIHEASAKEAGDSLGEVAGGLTGWLSTSLLVYADSGLALDVAVEGATKRLSSAGMLAFRETLHTLSSWAGSLPGNWDESVRVVWATAANAADISPIITLSEGEEVNEHLTEQAGQIRESLAVFPTNHNTAYHFNFHVKDIGHAAVIGPSGTGKSVLMNFLLTRWQQYKPCQTYIFDKDKSCYITTIANGGQYLDPAAGAMKMNPLAGLESDSDWEWFTSWLEILLTHREKDLTSADDKGIRNAVGAMRQIDPKRRRLLGMAALLPQSLADRLAPWVGDGQYSRWFDHEEDTFALGDFVTFAMDDLFRQPSVARAFLEYVFSKINRRMTG